MATPSSTPRPESELLAIRDILIHPAYQIRQKIDPATVSRYAQALRNGAVFVPVTVGHIRPPSGTHLGRPPEALKMVPEGALVLLDGFHRVEAHREAGLDVIAALVIPTSRKGALGIAARANLQHGLPLKPREVRFAFRHYVQAGLHRDEHGKLKSLRMLARELGPNHKTIHAWFIADFPMLARAYGEKDFEHGGPREATPKDNLGLAFGSSLRDILKAMPILEPGERYDVAALAQDLLNAAEALGTTPPEF